MRSGRGPGSKWTLSVYTLIDSANRLVWPRVAELLKSLIPLIPASSPWVLWLSWWDESCSVTVTSPGSNTQYCTGHLFNWDTPLHITPGVMDHDGLIISLHIRLEIKWGCSQENRHCWYTYLNIAYCGIKFALGPDFLQQSTDGFRVFRSRHFANIDHFIWISVRLAPWLIILPDRSSLYKQL